MTDKEKAVVMAYTGVTMLAGDKFSIFHKYVEDIMGRPVYTHEMGDRETARKIKEKALPDFLKICGDEFEEDQEGTYWQVEKFGISCSSCGSYVALKYDASSDSIKPEDAYCPHCGKKWKGEKK